VGVALVLLAAAGVLAQLARGRLGATGEPRVAPQATLQPRVEQLMIEGGRVFKTRTQAGLQRARQAYQAAVDLDPGHAPAHAALSFTLSVLHAFGVEAPHNVLPPAGVHARRALELDPTLAMGWHALAHYQVHWTREWALAEANYRRAIALDPSDVNPQFLLAHLLMGLQRPDEAVQQSLRALALDPDSAQLTTSSGIVHYFTRRVDEALRYLDRAQMLDPEYATAAFWKARTLAALDRPDAAMQQALRARRGMGNVPTWIVGYVHARAGRAREAHAVLEALEAYAGQHYVPPVELAYLHLALGDRARALARRAEGVDGRSRWIELMAVDPILDPLRDEPRFHALLARMGLPR
jgi:tetratricopeptide (TPR) repeat protein